MTLEKTLAPTEEFNELLEKFNEFLLPILEEQMIKINGKMPENYDKIETTKEKIDLLHLKMYIKK